MGLTTLGPDMLIYDEGEVYSCPVDHMNSVLAQNFQNDEEGKGYMEDWISHKEFEDLYYDAMACKPFYLDEE